MRQFPQLPHNESDVRSVETVQSTTIILGHVANEWLDPVLWDFSNTNVFQVENARPCLDYSRNHRICNGIFKEEVCKGNKSIDGNA